MSTSLTEAQLPEFRTWLIRKRPLGFALTASQVAVGDDTGACWTIARSNVPLLKTALTALRDSGRKAWAHDAGKVAVALYSECGVPLAHLTGILDASTAWAVVHPDKPLVASSNGAARDAVAAARFMVALPAGIAAATSAAVLASCHQEQLWRPVQARGWRVDVAMLEKELGAATRGRSAKKRELGLDLTDTTTMTAKAAIHAWLAIDEIFIVDKTGKPSLDRNDYEHTRFPGTEAAEARWATFREVRSISSKTDKLLEIKRALRGDRIYSTVVIHGAMTGRGTVVRPALQNIHRALRGLLIADEGFVLCALDLSQVEPRIAAGLSGDANLNAALLSGDVYASLAHGIWGADAHDENGKIRSEKRDRAKTLMLAIFYGKGKVSLAWDLRITPAAAQELLDSVWNLYPGLASYGAKLRSDMAAGQAELTSGGRPVPPPRRGPHAVLNNRVQAEGADLFYAAVTRVAAVVGPERLMLGIHDEAVLMVPAAEAVWATEVLEREMASNFRGMPITGGASVLGKAWGKPA